MKEEQTKRLEETHRRFDEKQEAKRVEIELEQQRLRDEQEHEAEVLLQQRMLDEAAAKRKLARFRERFEAEQKAIADELKLSKELNLQRLALEESSKLAKSPPPPPLSIDAEYAELKRQMAAQAAEMAALKQQVAGNSTSSNNSTAAAPSSTDNNECVICLDAKPTRLLFPCKHLCLCNRCWVSRYSSNVSVCPFCRGKVESTIEIFPA